MMYGQGRCLPLIGPAAGVYAEFAGPGPEDQPAGSGLAILQERPTQHIAQERSRRRWVLRIEQGMKRSDHLMRIWLVVPAVLWRNDPRPSPHPCRSRLAE
jgi:hypothetical protein